MDSRRQPGSASNGKVWCRLVAADSGVFIDRDAGTPVSESPATLFPHLSLARVKNKALADQLEQKLVDVLNDFQTLIAGQKLDVAHAFFPQDRSWRSWLSV